MYIGDNSKLFLDSAKLGRELETDGKTDCRGVSLCATHVRTQLRMAFFDAFTLRTGDPRGLS